MFCNNDFEILSFTILKCNCFILQQSNQTNKNIKILMISLLHVCLCVWWRSKIRLILRDLPEPLPRIERDISRAWHGNGLLLSSHCFIYHPKVRVLVCVPIFGLAHKSSCVLSTWYDERERLWWYVCVWTLSKFCVFSFCSYDTYTTRTVMKSGTEFWSSICVYLPVCVSLCIYNIGTWGREAAYWLT